jgi:hypothetical protein
VENILLTIFFVELGKREACPHNMRLPFLRYEMHPHNVCLPLLKMQAHVSLPLVPTWFRSLVPPHLLELVLTSF